MNPLIQVSTPIAKLLHVPVDKVAHALGGFLLSFSLNLAGYPKLGLLVAISAGAYKEWVYDKARPASHTVDPMDFAATSLGGVVGFVIRF